MQRFAGALPDALGDGAAFAAEAGLRGREEEVFLQDFLQALAKRLNQLFDGKCPVYLGRIWQGEKTPCFYLQLPGLKRDELICGRVRREIDLELHFYADSRQDAAAGLSCDLVAEKLLRGLGALAGVRRAYRG